MNKQGNSYLWGVLLVIVGIFTATIPIYKMCIKKGTDMLYDTSFTCINEPTFWVLMVIGIIIGTIGAYICYNTNKQ